MISAALTYRRSRPLIVAYVALAIIGAFVVWQGLGASRPTIRPPVSGQVIANTKPAFDLGRIIGAHLFGAEQRAEALPERAVALVLSGVLAGQDPSKGLAMIGEDARSTRLYSVGEHVPGGAALFQVFVDRALLSRDGVIETLLLPHKWASTGNGTLTGNANPSLALVPESRSEPTAYETLPVASAFNGRLRAERVISDDGKLEGIRFGPVNGDILAMRRLGLAPGDIVKSVDGIDVDRPEGATRAMLRLSSAESASVLVVRNGRTEALNLNAYGMPGGRTGN